MKNNSQPDAEELRHVILEIVVNRRPAAIAPHVIARHVKTELGRQLALEAIVAELEFLKGLNLLTCELDDFGSTKYWSATAAGVLAVERAS